MNTVLDDNKMLCLANSERIKLTPFIHMLFEVQDLAVASPATVSRCGMVYVDPNDLGFMPFVRTWLRNLVKAGKLKQEITDYICDLFDRYVDAGLKFITKKCTEAIPQVNIAKVQTLCKLLEVMLTFKGAPNLNLDAQKLNPLLCTVFVFCYVWGVGGNIIEANWDAFDNFVRQQFDDNGDCRVSFAIQKRFFSQRIVILSRFSFMSFFVTDAEFG